MGKGREGGGGPNSGPFYLVLWARSGLLAPLPWDSAPPGGGGDHWSQAHVRSHLLKFTSKGLFRRVFQHEVIFISLRATQAHGFPLVVVHLILASVNKARTLGPTTRAFHPYHTRAKLAIKYYLTRLV